MPDITLHVDLRLLAVVWHGQRDHPEHARTDAIDDGFDQPALASSIASLKHHDDPRPSFLHPVLQRAQLHLRRTQFLLVLRAVHALVRLRSVFVALRRALDRLCRTLAGLRHDLPRVHQAPASTAVTVRRSDGEERMISFSSSITRKNTKPPANRTGHTRSGTASLSNRACIGGA